MMRRKPMTSTAIDLSSPAFLVDPYPVYRQLQETEPAYKVPLRMSATDMWLITRYADVAALFKEARLSNDMSRVVPADQRPSLSGSLIFSDPPDHTRRSEERRVGKECRSG